MTTNSGTSAPARIEAATLVELLRRRACQHPERRAYSFLPETEAGEPLSLTYGELDRQARAIGARLQAAGAVGERALLLYPPGLDYVAAFFGCLYAGVIAVPAYPPQQNRHLSRLQAVAEDASAKIVLTTTSVLDRFAGKLEHTPSLKALAWHNTDGAEGGAEDGWQEPPVTGDSLAFLQYTSGSTGAPKGVMVSHRNLLHNSSLLAHGFEYTPETVCISWLPLYHDMGLIGGVLQPLYGGFPALLMSPVSFLRNPYGWLKAISGHRATLSGAPNFAYDLCVRKVTAEQRETLDLRSWEVAFTGAEPIRPETLERFAAAFEPCGFRREAFLPCYGLAEATLVVSSGSKATPPVTRAVNRAELERSRV
ncbi:MAG: fatty acyl-AMP ligase, partial [Acidobacteriota bacterium]|nr:fatty acyl-AMP ligase [Acidobacteriota bacterium]